MVAGAVPPAVWRFPTIGGFSLSLYVYYVRLPAFGSSKEDYKNHLFGLGCRIRGLGLGFRVVSGSLVYTWVLKRILCRYFGAQVLALCWAYIPMYIGT